MEQAEIERLKSENQRLKQQLNQDEKAKNEQFADELVNKGVLMPANKSQAVELLNYASDYDNGEVLNFSEGESLLSKVKQFLDSQPPRIHLHRELSADDGTIEQTTQYAENTPKDVIALDKRIRAYMHEKGVDYKTAFNEIHSTGEK
ncbi:hypothetical protein [Aggregatibacter actinomycetemcomitans]|uniref:hypothetical protein n=1 Tax=Aggregatibacter actinomycetemcomitans TaxID=714 RepID=UPI00197BEC54|nr:hypothetical protein [Aggregatibacter actinomycetemcomitans]MBN6064791.1 hypothetical protein [Aggregatibacter actinomycetemcomitans]MBN6081927.1 hypothetical protein [Aggregatibacter actinomycetemcomitans]MBN6084217.1 hypothetical protein [Aggregatibacter actinomycetemcomitans]